MCRVCNLGVVTSVCITPLASLVEQCVQARSPVIVSPRAFHNHPVLSPAELTREAYGHHWVLALVGTGLAHRPIAFRAKHVVVSVAQVVHCIEVIDISDERGYHDVCSAILAVVSYIYCVHVSVFYRLVVVR